MVFTIGLGRPVRRARELGESVATARLAADERLIEGRGRLLEEAPAAADIPRQALLNRYTNLVYHGIEILD